MYLHIFLVYGSEVVLPTDIAFRAPRVEHYNEEQVVAVQTEDVDRAEEERLITCARTAKYLEGLRRYYNRSIKGRSFAVVDLVLRRKQKTEGMHKLSSPWEGPYVIKEVTRPGSYRLCDLDGIDVPNSCTSSTLYVSILETLQICTLHFVMNKVLISIIWLYSFSPLCFNHHVRSPSIAILHNDLQYEIAEQFLQFADHDFAE